MRGIEVMRAMDAAADAAKRSDAPLGLRLQAVADRVREVSPGFAGVVDRLIARLADNGVGLSAPEPGDLMPPFVLPDDKGRLVSLDGLTAKGPVVVAFNRGHWCPYCRVHVDALAKAETEIKALGAQIVAISPESAAFGARLKADAGAGFPMLADLDGGYALELNLLFWLGEEPRRWMAGGGIDLLAYQGNDGWILPIPATFVVGADGIVKARFVDPDYRRRMEMEALMQAVRDCARG